MADYNISYRLSADTSGYSSSMGKAADSAEKLSNKQTLATSSADKFGNESKDAANEIGKMSAATGKAGDSAKGMGDKFATAGQVLGKAGESMLKISAASAGLIAVTAKMGMAYDREFSKITGLVGIAAEEVEVMKKNTLELAGATAQAPQDLAKAMFTLQSAGLRGSDATDSLRVAAELAAGGMGEAGTIAQALTSILDQYAKQGVLAAEAGDFLAATARAGNFESSQLAGGLGKVLPIASQLGIKISDVGGSVALLTRANGNASMSITQTAAAMKVLAAPSGEAVKILKDVGLSMADIRETATGPEGFVGALRQMQEAAGDTESFNKLLGSSEAILAANAILGASNEALEGTFGAVGDSAGVAAEVFAAAQSTDSFKFDQSINELKTAAIEFSTVTAPLLAEGANAVSGVVGSMVDAFSSLPPGIQDVVGGLVGVTAVAGPALVGLSKLSSALPKISSGFATMNPWVLGAAAAIAVGTLAYKSYSDQQQRNAEDSAMMVAWLKKEGDESIIAAEGIGGLIKEVAELRGLTTDVVGGEIVDLDLAGMASLFDRFEAGGVTATEMLVDLGLTFRDVADITADGTDAFDNYVAGIGELNFDENGDEAERFAIALFNQAEAAGFSEGQIKELFRALDRQADATDDARESVEEQTQALLIGEVAAGRLSDKTLQLALDQADSEGAIYRYTDAAVLLTEELTNGETALDAKRQAEERAFQAALDHERVLKAMGDALDTTVTSTQEAEDALKALEEAEARAAAEAQNLLELLGSTAQGFDLATAAGGKYREFLDGTVNTQKVFDDAVVSTLESFESLAEASGEIGGAFEETAGIYDRSDKSQRDFIDTSRGVATAIRDQTFAMIANGDSVEDVARFQSEHEESLRDTLQTAGLLDSEINDLIDTYGNVPEEIITMYVADVSEANVAVDDLLVKIDKYGTYDVEAIARLEADQARRLLGELLLGFEEYERLNIQAVATGDFTQLDTAIGLALAGLSEVDRAEVEAKITASLDYSDIQTFVDSFEGVLEFSATVDPMTVARIQDQLKAALDSSSIYGPADLGSIGGGAFFTAEMDLSRANSTMQSFFSYWQAQDLNIVASVSNGGSYGSTPSGPGGSGGYYGSGGSRYTNQEQLNEYASRTGMPMSQVQALYGQTAAFFHDGGWVGGSGGGNWSGLASDEVPAVLQTGEYVMSKSMISGMANQSAGSTSTQNASVNIAPGAIVVNGGGASNETAALIGAELAKFERRIVNTFRGTGSTR